MVWNNGGSTSAIFQLDMTAFLGNFTKAHLLEGFNQFSCRYNRLLRHEPIELGLQTDVCNYSHQLLQKMVYLLDTVR